MVASRLTGGNESAQKEGKEDHRSGRERADGLPEQRIRNLQQVRDGHGRGMKDPKGGCDTLTPARRADGKLMKWNTSMRAEILWNS